jgi:hypothetical protein
MVTELLGEKTNLTQKKPSDFWSGPLFCGPNHWRGTFQKTVVRTTIPGSNRRAWFIPERIGLNQRPVWFYNAVDGAQNELATTGSTLETVHTELYATRRHRGDTRSASPLHIARPAAAARAAAEARPAAANGGG